MTSDKEVEEQELVQISYHLLFCAVAFNLDCTFFDNAVGSFNHAIGFWSKRFGKAMIDPQCIAKLIKAVIVCRLRLSFGEAVREFCPVVGQDMRDGKRKKGMAFVHEVFGVVYSFVVVDLVVYQSSSPVYGDKQIVLYTVDLRQVGHIHMQKARSVPFELFRFGFFLLRYAADAKRTQCSGERLAVGIMLCIVSTRSSSGIHIVRTIRISSFSKSFRA